MIVEERIYDLHPGKVAEYRQLVETEGIAIQRPILGRLIGYFYSEIGDLNQVVHLWAYDSLDDRAARRARLFADPGWRAFTPKLTPLLIRQRNRILLPFAFSPDPGPHYVAGDAAGPREPRA
jgi:hypothetical protein